MDPRHGLGDPFLFRGLHRNPRGGSIASCLSWPFRRGPSLAYPFFAAVPGGFYVLIISCMDSRLFMQTPNHFRKSFPNHRLPETPGYTFKLYAYPCASSPHLHGRVEGWTTKTKALAGSPWAWPPLEVPRNHMSNESNLEKAGCSEEFESEGIDVGSVS